MCRWYVFLLGIAVAVLVGVGRTDALAAEAQPPDDGKLRIIVFGGHPDDAELRCGGVGAMWSALGHHVKFVSATNGDIGHWRMAGGPLAIRRTAEVRKADEILGVVSRVLDIHDGELMPTLENRKIFTRLIRRWNADLVIAHRPNDYHPDHRYTGVLVQDSAFMVSVPFLCPDTPPVKRNPVYLYCYDRFQQPNPFRADIVVAIDEVIEKKLDAVLVMESQFIEGGCGGDPSHLPKDEADLQKRRAETRRRLRNRFAGMANIHRDKLIEVYGKEKGSAVRYAEVFQVCEYGKQPSPADIRRLFPFLPKKE